MSAVLFQQRTFELEALLDERRAKGLDDRDEVWEGTYVIVSPAPSLRHAKVAKVLVRTFDAPAEARGLEVVEIANVGDQDNYRIPDVTVFDPGDADPRGVWLSTAAVVVEIASPGEDPEAKLPFYAAREVDEVVLIDMGTRSLRWLALRGGRYTEVERSEVLDLGAQGIADQFPWP